MKTIKIMDKDYFEHTAKVAPGTEELEYRRNNVTGSMFKINEDEYVYMASMETEDTMFFQARTLNAFEHACFLEDLQFNEEIGYGEIKWF